MLSKALDKIVTVDKWDLKMFNNKKYDYAYKTQIIINNNICYIRINANKKSPNYMMGKQLTMKDLYFSLTKGEEILFKNKTQKEFRKILKIIVETEMKAGRM